MVFWGRRKAPPSAGGEATVANEAPDEREQALQYAARLRGLSLVRTGDKFALARYLVSNATLDQIAAFLVADADAQSETTGSDRRADLRSMLKAERALLIEIEQEKRRAGERGREQTSTESALAEIRRRIAEIQGEMGHKRSR